MQVENIFDAETSQFVVVKPGLVYEKLNGSGVEKHLTHLGRPAVETYLRTRIGSESVYRNVRDCLKHLPDMWRFVVTSSLPAFDSLLPHLELSTRELCGEPLIQFSGDSNVALLSVGCVEPLFVLQKMRSASGKRSIQVACASDQSLAQLIGALHVLKAKTTTVITKQSSDGLEPLGALETSDRSACRAFLEEFEPRINDPEFCRQIGLMVLCRVQDIQITGRKALLDF
jgi:hypothetical protein